MTNKSFKFGDLTYLEIKERVKNGCIAIVPTGCTEQQGYHLPVDFDTWLAEEITLNAAQKCYEDFGVDCLVLPTMPFGPTPEHRNYGAGFIDIPDELHNKILYYILKSLCDQEFKKIIVWRGCGGHKLSNTIDMFNKEFEKTCKAFIPEHPFYEIWCNIGDKNIPGGHADSFSTSISFYKRPNSIRAEYISNPECERFNWDDPSLDFSIYSKTGVIGDPTYSNCELGKKLWNEVIDCVSKKFKQISEMN